MYGISFVLYPIFFTLAIVIGCILWCLLWDIAKKKYLEIGITFVFAITFLLYIYPGYINRVYIGSTVAISFFKIIVTIFTLKLLSYIKLKARDYIVLAFALFVIQEFCSVWGFRKSLLFLGAWILFLSLSKMARISLKIKAVPILVTFLGCFFSYVFYSLLFEFGLKEVYYVLSKRLGLTRVEKVFFIGIISGILILILAVILYVMKKAFAFYYQRIEEFSVKYEEIGQYVLLIPWFLAMLLLFIDCLPYLYLVDTNYIQGLVITVFVVVFVGMQLFYLKLLMRTIELKDHLEYKETEQLSLKNYNYHLDQNMQEIRAMKHDLKNIFLTMGEYVKRSNDTELKEYYYQNIAPFAGNEIRMNDLYVNLQQINNESLKAFLYYKLLQGIELNLDMRLETVLDHTVFPYLQDCSDIIRILGIFLDNAMEESTLIKNGFVKINLVEKEWEATLSVRNVVRETVIKSGIHIGISSKGLNRGNGLFIVDKLVKKHDDILWNSYFRDGIYIQSITIRRR